MFGDRPFQPHSFDTRFSFLPGSQPGKPKIILTREAYTRMWLYVDIAPEEIGWLGTVTEIEPNVFLIDKVVLLRQQVHGTETELSIAGLQEHGMELLMRGDAGIDEWNSTRFWGHSHVHMGTHPSSTDENTMSDLGRSSEFRFPWFIRGIFNKNGRAQFTLFDFDKGLKVDDVPWELMKREENAAGQKPVPEDRTIFRLYQPCDADVTEELRSAVEAEFKEKVRSKYPSWLSWRERSQPARTRVPIFKSPEETGEHVDGSSADARGEGSDPIVVSGDEGTSIFRSEDTTDQNGAPPAPQEESRSQTEAAAGQSRRPVTSLWARFCNLFKDEPGQSVEPSPPGQSAGSGADSGRDASAAPAKSSPPTQVQPSEPPRARPRNSTSQGGE